MNLRDGGTPVPPPRLATKSAEEEPLVVEAEPALAVWRSEFAGDLVLLLELPLLLLFLRQPPPTGTFLKVPPRVQYLLQALQK